MALTHIDSIKEDLSQAKLLNSGIPSVPFMIPGYIPSSNAFIEAPGAT